MWDQPFDALMEKLAGWAEGAILALPNLIAALIVLLLFWLVARGIRLALARGLERTGAPGQIQRLLVTLAGLVVITAGVLVALGILELDKALASLLAGAGIIGLAAGFALQDIAANFMAGVLLSIRRPIRLGDLIRTNDYFGTVERIELRATVLRTPTGQIVLIPNKDVFNKPIENFTESGQRRVDVEVGVSYGDDLEKAEQITRAAVEGVSNRDSNRPVELFYEEFGDSSVNFVVRFWVSSTAQGAYLEARSQAIKRIRRAFTEGGITIPFPIRTLDFGIVGGERLADALPAGLFGGGNGGDGVRRP